MTFFPDWEGTTEVTFQRGLSISYGIITKRPFVAMHVAPKTINLLHECPSHMPKKSLVGKRHQMERSSKLISPFHHIDLFLDLEKTRFMND